MLFDFCLGLCVVTVTGAVQPRDSIMLLFGRNSRQTTQPIGLPIDKQTIGDCFDK